MYEKLTIKFFEGKTVEFIKGEWGDYSYNGEFVIVKNRDAWIAMYSAKNVLSVELG